jgi:hypothetical protein
LLGLLHLQEMMLETADSHSRYYRQATYEWKPRVIVLLGRLCNLDEDTIVDLEKTGQLKDFAGFGAISLILRNKVHS